VVNKAQMEDTRRRELHRRILVNLPLKGGAISSTRLWYSLSQEDQDFVSSFGSPKHVLARHLSLLREQGNVRRSRQYIGEKQVGHAFYPDYENRYYRVPFLREI